MLSPRIARLRFPLRRVGSTTGMHTRQISAYGGPGKADGRSTFFCSLLPGVLVFPLASNGGLSRHGRLLFGEFPVARRKRPRHKPWVAFIELPAMISSRPVWRLWLYRRVIFRR